MVTLSKKTTDAEMDSIATILKAEPFTKDLTTVTAEAAAAEFIEGVGEDFATIMGQDTAMHPNIKVFLNANFINRESIDEISDKYARPGTKIEKVEYEIESLLDARENAKWVTIGSAIIALIVMIIAYFIVRSAIRLAVYSKRLIIRSMQLIGATPRFIRRPFLRMGILQGFFGALLAVSGIVIIAMHLVSTRILPSCPRWFIPWNSSQC